MSTVKISELTALTSADAADELVIVDDSAGVTKKITYDSLATDIRTESEPLTATTVTASGLVTASSGITFGADTLDDYEEGSWTPTLTFGGNAVSLVYASRSGYYVKIGDLVFITLQISLASTGSSTGTAEISDLPFSVADVLTGTSVRAALSIAFADNITNADHVAIRNTQNIDIYPTNNNVGLTDSNFASGSNLRLSGCYVTS